MTVIPDAPNGPLDSEPGLPPVPEPDLPPDTGPDDVPPPPDPDIPPQPDPLTDATYVVDAAHGETEDDHAGDQEKGEPPFPMRSLPREDDEPSEPPFPMHQAPRQAFPSFTFPKDHAVRKDPLSA